MALISKMNRGIIEIEGGYGTEYTRTPWPFEAALAPPADSSDNL
jgi:hypothetical protein